MENHFKNQQQQPRLLDLRQVQILRLILSPIQENFSR